MVSKILQFIQNSAETFLKAMFPFRNQWSRRSKVEEDEGERKIKCGSCNNSETRDTCLLSNESFESVFIEYVDKRQHL